MQQWSVRAIAFAAAVVVSVSLLSAPGTGGAVTTRDAPQAARGTAAARWEKVVPGGDCHCADGSEFAFWARRADPTKVVFFLDGGGVCYDAKTCAFTGLSHGGEA